MKNVSLALAVFGWVAAIASGAVLCTIAHQPLYAQTIIPASDGAGTEVIPNGNGFEIDKGSRSSDGTNLFHSFQQFGLDAGQVANFISSPEIRNILGRVVGGNPSIIDGLIQVTGGNANLYLMNPAGIVFGANTSLNVPAAFTATTATRIGFGENNWFNAFGSNNYNSLVGTPSQFAFDIAQPGVITNAGSLAVREGQSLTLVGGSITNTGEVIAPSGNITIAGVPGENLVKISQAGHVLSLEISPDTTADGQMLPIQPQDLPAMLTGNSGHVLNQGQVLTNSNTNDGGDISLVGRVVENRGEIAANGSNGGSVRINTTNLLDSGAIRANGTTGNSGEIGVNYTGTVIQTATAQTEAKGKTQGGAIAFNGTANSVLTASGTLDVTGEVGGKVHLFGQDLRLLATKVDATGNSGGGEILVGGDYQGQTQGAINAQTTFVNHASILNADSLTTGHGGKVIVWSDQQTSFYGSITARGGSLTGNGGLMEVSSKNELVFGGMANASATNGQAGQLLLDPKNITIDDSVSSGSFQLLDPNPAAGNGFGARTAVLSNGNIVVSSPNDDLIAQNAGTVYLLNPNTGALLGSINGANAEDRFGNYAITTLPNNNYVFANPFADIDGIVDAGTVILANGSTGAEINRISGTNGNDRFGGRVDSLLRPFSGQEIGLIVALPDGNYVFGSPDADIGGVVDAGTVILANGNTGTEINRISGTNANDRFGSGAITALPNNNYVFGNPLADIGGVVNGGTVIFANGTTGVEINRISGAFANDRFGGRSDLPSFLDIGSAITALPNGNFVFGNPYANVGGVVDAGTVILANGTTGAEISRISGVNGGDNFGNGAITALFNGNYVFGNPYANNLAGTVILANGTTGAEISRISGVNTGNLAAGDFFGYGAITALPNGNYVFANFVANINGILDAGTVILANGTTGAEISRISGTNASDQFGGGEYEANLSSFPTITALPNGNYVFGSILADINGIVDTGTGILANGTTGAEISRISGANTDDNFGLPITVLPDGNYVLGSFLADINGIGDAGTVILVNGDTGAEISRLSGANANDFFGVGGITALSNGNYLVASPEADLGGRVDIVVANPNSLTYSYFPDQNITINPQLITQITNTGTAVALQANNDITVNSAITTNNPTGNGGDLTFQAGRSILVNANITTDNGDLTLIANETVANGVVNPYRDPGTAVINIAPEVTLNSGTGNTTLQLNTDADLTNNSSGTITTGDITTTGGNITINATNGITTGNLNSHSSEGDGGDITLNTTSGNIQVTTMNSQGGTSGTGGKVDITTPNFFQATGTFTDQNGTIASISTAGGSGGGTMIIRHGGNGITPFVVGNAETNGTAAVITTGNAVPEQTISPTASFLNTHTQDGIQIISVPGQTLPPPDSDTSVGSNPISDSSTNSQLSLGYFIADLLGADTIVDQDLESSDEQNTCIRVIKLPGLLACDESNLSNCEFWRMVNCKD